MKSLLFSRGKMDKISIGKFDKKRQYGVPVISSKESRIPLTGGGISMLQIFWACKNFTATLDTVSSDLSA